MGGELTSGRRLGPDQLRGLLLTLVIFGHTYAAGVSDDRSKWLIYGFHMPLFFAISGWLLTTSSLTRRTLPQLLTHYWRRMIWQWLLVSVAFGLWKGKLPASPRGTIDILFYEPLFHLWFIPALVIMVVITQVVLLSGCGWATLAGVAAVSFALFELPIGQDYLPESLTTLDHRYGAYFVWFLLGFAVRNASIDGLRRPPERAVAALGLALTTAGAVVFFLAFGGGAWQHDIGFAALNLGLVALLPAMLSALDQPLPLIGDAVARMGRGSLWIYLLHPFATETFRPHDDGTWRGRLIGAGITIAIVAVATALSHLLERRRGRSPVPGQVRRHSSAVPRSPGGLGERREQQGREQQGREPLTGADTHVPGAADDARQPR